MLFPESYVSSHSDQPTSMFYSALSHRLAHLSLVKPRFFLKKKSPKRITTTLQHLYLLYLSATGQADRNGRRIYTGPGQSIDTAMITGRYL